MIFVHVTCNFRIPVRSLSPGAVPKNKKEKETLVSGVPKQKKKQYYTPTLTYGLQFKSYKRKSKSKRQTKKKKKRNHVNYASNQKKTLPPQLTLTIPEF